MEINDELILKWEPQVNAMLRRLPAGMGDREDAAQMLRMAIVRAASHYDETRGVASFHTYLFWAMLNTLRTFIDKSMRHQDEPITEELVNANDAFAYTQEMEIEQEEIFSKVALTSEERLFADMALQGYNIREIKKAFGEKNFVKIRKGMRNKFEFLRGPNAKIGSKKVSAELH